MAPALIEAAATVSQSSANKFNFMSTNLLEDLAGDFARRRGISTRETERTLEKSSGRLTTKVANTAIKNQVLNKKDIDFSIDYKETMNAAKEGHKALSSETETVSNTDTNFDQSSGPSRGLSTSETCALSEVEGGKSVGCRSQPLAESTPCKMLKERTKKNDSNVQVLERRARNLKHRLRSFQTGRLLSHVKTQAQLLDYSNKVNHDPRTRAGPNENELNSDLGKSVPMIKRTIENCINTPTASSPRLASLLKSEPQQIRDLSHKGGTPPLGPVQAIDKDDCKLSSITNGKKKAVFGVLANSVQDVMQLHDPDATDSESDEDILSIPRATSFLESRMPTNEPNQNQSFDPIWAKDRVKIGSMCTWIQAQIADLSHKIKRYGDLHHHIKSNRQQLSLEESRKQVITNTDIQRHLEESLRSKDDLNGDSLQGNIFARLQAHKNGLAKELSAQSETEVMYEKGSGARTIPAAKLPRHKYVRRSIETAFKGNSISYQCSNLPAPFPCAQCFKATATGFGKTTENTPAVLLDHSYHQQLSTKYDLSLPLLLEASLRKDKICVDKKNLKPAASAKSTLTDNFSSRVGGDHSAPTKSAKLKLDKKRNRRRAKQIEDDSDKEDSPVSKKKVPPTAASLLQRRANSLRAPSSGSGESRPATPITEQSVLSASCPSSTLSQIGKKKSRTSSEYDINNIVIPYSIASSTRLEKPQYKEILTPGWRSIECDVDDMTCEEIEQMEDTKESAYSQRHSRYEASEHHKFTAFFQLPLKRSRSNRKSSECNTPEPYSPSHPDTPSSAHTPTEFILATPSSSKGNKVAAWTLQSNLDENRVTPWPSRSFPLEGEDLVSLDDENSSACATHDVSMAASFTVSRSASLTGEEANDVGLPEERVSEKASSLSTNSSDSEVVSPTLEHVQEGENEDDDDDEKWTVKLLTEVKSSPADPGTVRKGIVLKLAKK